LTRILQERRRRSENAGQAKIAAKGNNTQTDTWKSKYAEPVGADTSSLPGLPVGWCWATVEQLSALLQYGTSAKTGEDAEGVPVVRMGNIVDGQLSLEVDALKYLPRNHEEFPNLFLEIGDMLFNRTNSAELVGKSAVYLGLPSPCSFASYLIRVRFVGGIQPGYVAALINSPAGRAWVASVKNQQVGQANVNGSKLAVCPVPLPPAAEQERIAAELDRVGSNIDTLSAGVARDHARVARLRQAILKWAFEGRLADQDPKDEPASLLLERIRLKRGEPSGDGKRASRAPKRETA
jgi:type I restriction enzyme S subunit